MSELHLYYALLQIFYFLSFVFAVIATYRKNLPGYMNGFFWYPLIGVILISFFWLTETEVLPLSIFQLSNRLSLIFHYLFFSVFICKVLKMRGSVKNEIRVCIVFSLVTCFFVFYDIYHKTIISPPVVNTIIFGFCIYFYHKICLRPDSIKLTNDPSFWVVTGVFFCMGITIPVNIFNRFLSENLLKNYYYQVMLIGAIGYSVMHLFFVKALICKPSTLK